LGWVVDSDVAVDLLSEWSQGESLWMGDVACVQACLSDRVDFVVSWFASVEKIGQALKERPVATR
jgi:hypothetical protein